MRFIYSIILFLTQKWARLSMPKAQVWARNSFRLDYFQNWKSDLDLTFFYPGSGDRQVAQQHRLFFQKIHRCFPIICECNVYFENDLSLVFKNINFYELQRDPDLKSRFSTSSTASSTQAVVFISRMMFSDFKNLDSNWRSRHKKWNFHFQQIERKLDIDEAYLKQILGFFTQSLRLSEAENVAMSQQLFNYCRAIRDGKHALDFRGKLHDQVWLWTFFPHHFPFAAHELSPLQEKNLNVIYDQLRWEIFGALTQYANFSEPIFQAQLKDCLLLIERLQVQDSDKKRWDILAHDFKEALKKISS